jgi:hypothetical protein
MPDFFLLCKSILINMLSTWLRNTRMGYISGQSGIMRRMLREEGGWQSHLVKTSEYIQQIAKDQQPKSIRILGSGWLLDVPMKYLIENCGKVILADLFHPHQIINKYSKYKNVEFETIDITGGMVEICYRLKKKDFNFENFIKQIESINQIKYQDDLVISVNLLSQLSVILTDFLVKKLDLTTSQVLTIAESIQSKHLKTLPLGKTLLITDYEEEYYDGEDRFIGSKPTVFSTLPKGRGDKEWTWKFDTRMMYKEECKTYLKVIAKRL